jgi:predicted XRE-type DNA-binding protein
MKLMMMMNNLHQMMVLRLIEVRESRISALIRNLQR